MLQIYTDGQIAYDSRLPGYELLKLVVVNGLNKGGTAEITMPPGHPAYSMFTSYKTQVTIYRDDLLLFRGRALYPTDDFYGRRTITCEGERCFLRDGVMRPYLYQDSPAVIFTDIIDIYNSQVEEEKQFLVGTIDVTDPNDYIRLESESAEQLSNAIDKLVERVGGYVVFTTNDAGKRVINWYASPGYHSNQTIEFGENLLDFVRSQSSDLATVVIPYGAKDNETGERVTITDINNGQDFIQDDDAVALRGVIIKPVFWDDVTDPTNLLRKAQQYLATSKMLITSLVLSALDLSVIDKSIEAFRVGDTIRVRSKPHGVDDDFQLRERTYNLLDPSQDKVTLGKDLATLTGADVAGDRESLEQLHRTERVIKSDYELNMAKAVAETVRTLTTLIEQTSESIKMQVSAEYTTSGELESRITSTMTQLSNQLTLKFEETVDQISGVNGDLQRTVESLVKHFDFNQDGLTITAGEGTMSLRIDNDVIVFEKNGQQFGRWDGVDFHTGNIIIEVNERAQFGNFAAVPRASGNLSWMKVRG